MILINRTYEEYDSDDLSDGDCCEPSETGFDSQDEPCSFRELVSLMREHNQPSCWPAQGSTFEWFQSEHEPDYQTGTERRTAIHYSRSNPNRAARYWRLAAIAAGHVKP